MYTIILNTGEVYRNSDWILISPAETITQDFIDYNNWVHDGNNPIEVMSPGSDYDFINGEFLIKLDIIKAQKALELSNAFNEQFKSGSFMSSLGFRVDNRRYDNKNDKDNLLSLIDLGITFFKDADGNTHNLTMEDMLILKTEMSEDGLKKYQTKWYYENLILSATSSQELDFNIIFG